MSHLSRHGDLETRSINDGHDSVCSRIKAGKVEKTIGAAERLGEDAAERRSRVPMPMAVEHAVMMEGRHRLQTR